MATHDHQLAHAPVDSRARELWLQDAAGFVLSQDVRAYALAQLDANLSPEVKTVAEQAIDDALYGLMMVLDGVTGALRNDRESVELSMTVRRRAADGTVLDELPLADGDGMCMGHHRWVAGDFGPVPVAEPADR